MTIQQIKWARLHDWYVSDNGCAVTVLEQWRTPDMVWHEQLVEFTDFTSLYHWAGY